MTVKLNVTGMTCAACSARVEKAVRGVPGVIKADVNLLAGKLTAQVEHSDVERAIISAIRTAGYDVSLDHETSAKKQDTPDKTSKVLIRIIVSSVFLIAAATSSCAVGSGALSQSSSTAAPTKSAAAPPTSSHFLLIFFISDSFLGRLPL